MRSQEMTQAMAQAAIVRTLNVKPSCKKETFQTGSRILVHPEMKRS